MPSSAVTVASCQITAALPLSQMSVSVVDWVAEPDAGIGAWTVMACEPCTTWPRLICTPGISTEGASVSWKVGATTPNDGSTCESPCSVVHRSTDGSRLSPGRAPAPMPRW